MHVSRRPLACLCSGWTAHALRCRSQNSNGALVVSRDCSGVSDGPSFAAFAGGCASDMLQQRLCGSRRHAQLALTSVFVRAG